MDEPSQCYNCNEKISLRLSKNSNNDNWLVNQCHTDLCIQKNRESLQKPLKTTPKNKPSLKVSVPICVWNAVQQKKYSESTTPTSNNSTHTSTVAHWLPTSSNRPERLSRPLSPSGARMFRHPVPTTKGRTTLNEKYDQIVKDPKPIPPKTTFQRAISMPIVPEDAPSATKEPTKDTEKNKTEESNIVQKPKTPAETCLLRSFSLEPPLPIKHKLPFAVVPNKGTYSKKTVNPINKENSTQTTTEQGTQTEKCPIVTVEDIEILEMVKNSGLTTHELQNYLENGKKDKEMINENDGVIIDLVNNLEEDANEMYAKVVKHSVNNKNVLNKIVEMLQQNNDLTSQPSTSPPQTPACPATAPSVEQTPFHATSVTADPLKSPFGPQNSFEVNDIQKGFAVSAMLLQMGFRIVRVEPQTQSTQTDDQSTNKKRRLSSSTDENQTATEIISPFELCAQRPPVIPTRPPQETPALVPEMQEILPPVLPPPNPPRPQLRQQPQYVSQHIDRQATYPNTSGLMPHQRVQNTAVRNQYHVNVITHNPFEHNRSNATFTTTQMPVQIPASAQLHPHDPRRQGLRGQLPNSGHPHLMRVISTNEANMHSSQAQQPSWNYAQYYDRQGNVYPQPQRHQ